MIKRITAPEMIDMIIRYCRLNLGLKEMALEDIGTNEKGVMRFDTIDEYVWDACGSGAHTFDGVPWDDRYRFLRNQNRPEYVLDHLIRLGYVKKRQTGIIVQSYEDELKETLHCLCEKYGGEEVELLKERLRIQDIW
ncbi:MAG: hypothetical protein U9Q69_03435 [Nanoarchaeota archaeon]|nr:hypothetical protein [Nanoarchaeota archaeon]